MRRDSRGVRTTALWQSCVWQSGACRRRRSCPAPRSSSPVVPPPPPPVTCTLLQEIASPKILIIEGLHPFYDDRVNELVDFRIYLDISGALMLLCCACCEGAVHGVGVFLLQLLPSPRPCWPL